MKKLLPLILVTLILSGKFSYAQLISKKESLAIDNILNEASAAHKPATYLIQHVNILTMKDSVILKNQDVLIENGIIQDIGTGLQQPQAIIIDGTGKYLMPGLTDMHVHLFAGSPMQNTWILNLIINGVTTVRDLYGSPEKLVLREKINRNELLAPTLYQSSKIINGINDKFSLYAADEKMAREIVVAQKKAGYDFIKVYDGLSKNVYTAILDEAAKQKILVVGHVPDALTVTEVIALGQSSIEHLTGYFEWQNSQIKITASDDYASVTAASEIWNCPTIYNHLLNGSRQEAQSVIAYAKTSGLIPKGITNIWEKKAGNTSKEVVAIVDTYGPKNFETLEKILLNLYHSNAKLIAGTDAGSLPLLIPGYALHRELKTLNAMGIPIYEVLKMATANAAMSMDKESAFGTVERGKRADLLLLNDNPLQDLTALQHKSGMMLRGIWLSANELTTMRDKVKLAFGKH